MNKSNISKIQIYFYGYFYDIVKMKFSEGTLENQHADKLWELLGTSNSITDKKELKDETIYMIKKLKKVSNTEGHDIVKYFNDLHQMFKHEIPDDKILFKWTLLHFTITSNLEYDSLFEFIELKNADYDFILEDEELREILQNHPLQRTKRKKIKKIKSPLKIEEENMNIDLSKKLNEYISDQTPNEIVDLTKDQNDSPTASNTTSDSNENFKKILEIRQIKTETIQSEDVNRIESAVEATQKIKKKYENKKNENCELKINFLKVFEDVKNLKKSQSILEEKIKNLETNNRNHNSTNASLKKKNDDLNQEVTSLKNTVTSLKKKNDDLNQEVTSLKTKNDDLNQEVTSLKATVTSLQTKNDDLNHEITNLNQKNLDLDRKLINFTQENLDLKQISNILRQENLFFKIKISNLEQENLILSCNIQTLNEEIRNLKEFNRMLSIENITKV